MPKLQNITVNFVSLGCPKNLVDSETMLGLLHNDDFKIVAPDTHSHVTIINTCGFVEEAKKESIDTILSVAQGKKNGERNLIVVTGCLSQRYREELPKLIPEVDLFVGTGEYDKLPGLIRHKLAGKPDKVFVENPRFVPDHLTPRLQTTPFYTRYVKISEGCSHQCSFCIIPFMRGQLRSRQVDSVVSEIQTSVKNGVKEFNLVAQDLNEYGRDLNPRTSLYALLEKLNAVDGEFWLRLMYMYPLQFPHKLAKLIAQHRHIVPYVDIPLQHISDRMLKRMNRGSAQKYIYSLIETLREHIPHITLRTTFIAGHPGETKKDFEELLKFVEWAKFDRMGVFGFSVEEGTPSATMPDQVPKKIIQSRLKQLMTLQNQISNDKHKNLIGLKLPFLVESLNKNMLSGRLSSQAPEIDGQTKIRLKRTETPPKIGSIIQVKITQANAYDLRGVLCVL